ncbi:MAG: TolC family protein, partial [Bacteriovoracaceae bacterium]|nr:TolC family protein [Bacteriovoracaceae bacterium]
LLKQIRQIKKSQLRHTSFIYRLSKEKLGLGKIKRQEFLQSKEEFLRSHQEFQDINAQVALAEEELAQVLGDELSTTYTLTNQLKYAPLNIAKDESINFAHLGSPELKQAKVELANANRTFEKTLKENLPLPKLSVRLGAYRHSFSNQGSNDSVTTYGDGRNVEIAASINMKWSIFGSGGFFNSRVRERSYFDKRIAEINFTEAKRDVRVAIVTFHRRIAHLEQKVEAAQARLRNSRALFDLALDRYISGKTSFPDIKLALDSLVGTEQSYEQAKYEHLAQKLNLANASGIDDFPGEKFDNLVLK